MTQTHFPDMHQKLFQGALALILAGALGAAGQDTGGVSGQAAATVSSPVWENGIARLGGVRIDPASRTVLATGWVNQVVGLIELLACGPGGKTHESVFVLDVNPLDLQAGLLLLGLRPGTP
ncbi:MAG: hypothetical protein V1873_08095, partial [Verrucomicrobiota bacterium]